MLINSSGIVTSRKRKLRELFAVSENELQLPTVSFKNPDVPPISAAEARFLDVTDILQYVYIPKFTWRELITIVAGPAGLR